MKPKFTPLKTQTGEYFPSHATNVAKTFKRERDRLKAEAEKPSNVRDMSDIFRGAVKRG